MMRLYRKQRADCFLYSKEFWIRFLQWDAGPFPTPWYAAGGSGASEETNRKEINRCQYLLRSGVTLPASHAPR